MNQPEGSARTSAAAAAATGSLPPSAGRSDRVPPLAWVIAAVFVAVELAVSKIGRAHV